MKNKRLTKLLVFLLVAVWGAVAYEVFASINGDAEESSVNGDGVPLPRQASRFIYKADVRDPFRSRVMVVRDSTRAKKVLPPPVWMPPPVKLNGILARKGKKTAVFEGTRGEVAFLSEGDTLYGMKVLRISDRSIVYQYMKQKKEWLLEGK